MNTQIEIPHLQTPEFKLQTLDPPPSARRNGKIARLPKPTRDMINRMLDDGLPYQVIIDELGEAGQGLNLQNLTNWKQGGYLDWVKHREMIARAQAQMEVATDLLRETKDISPGEVYRACSLVAGTQILTALMEYGDETLRKMLLNDAATYITLLNTICNLANSGLRFDEYHLALAEAAKRASPNPSVLSGVRPSSGAACSFAAGSPDFLDAAHVSELAAPGGGSHPSSPINPNQASEASPHPSPPLGEREQGRSGRPSSPINLDQASEASPDPSPPLGEREQGRGGPSSPINSNQGPGEI